MRSVFLVTLIALTGCDVGEVKIGGNPGVDGGGGGDSGVNAAAEAAFNMKVVPAAMTQGCTKVVQGAICHTLQPPVLTTYADFIRAPQYMMKPATANRLILGPPATLVNGIHPQTPAGAGVAYLTDPQKADISMFIDMYGM